MVAYTRQSTITDGDTITAALFNNEYNQLLSAFSYASSGTTGHKHDGTAGEGGHVPQIGDQDFLNKIVTDSTNNRFGIFVQVSSSAVEQIRIQDGAIVPVTDNDIDLGTSSVEFKDAYFDGTVTTDALVADTADINGGTVDGATIGASSATTIVGTTITANTAFVPDASDGAALGTSSLEFSDLFLADAAVINFGDDQDVTLTHVADTGLLLNSTMQLQFNDSSQYINAPSATVLDINATDEIELNAMLVDVNANLDISGTYTGAGLMTTGGNIVIPNDGNIGSVGDTDAIAISSGGVVTFSQNPVFPDGGVPLDDLDIDGATDIGAALVDADLFIVDDGAGGTNRKTEASRIKTYIADVTLTTAAQTNITSLGTLTALTVDDIGVDGKVITMTGSTNDTATLTVGTNGTLTIETVDTAAAAANIQVTADGTFEVDGTTITLDSSGDIVLDADGGDVFFKDAGTTFGSATNTSGNLIIKSGTTTALTFSGANVTGAGTYTGGGTMTTGGNIIIPDDGNIGSASDTDAIAISSAGLVTISQDLSVTDDVTIGDDLLLDSDAAVLKFGDDQDVTLTHVADTGLLLNSTMQLQFNDASQNINAPSATVLDINATDEVEINATLADVNANLDVSGTYTGGGLMTTGGNIVIPDAGNIGSTSDTDAIAISSAGLVTVSQDLTVGDDLKLASDAAVLGFGADNDVTLTHVADTGLLLNSTMQLQFNDASQNINAPSATVLDINATDEIELNATLADVNANLDVSGTYTGGGTMTTGGNIVIPDGGTIGSASDTDAMAIASTGETSFTQNVGVGIADPVSFLHLQKSDATAYDATDSDGQVSVGPTIYLENPANSNTTVGGQIVFGMRSTEAQARIGATGGSSPALVFGTADAERMRIDSNGHVLPAADSTYDLGANATRFRQAYIDEIDIGDNSLAASAANAAFVGYAGGGSEYAIEVKTDASTGVAMYFLHSTSTACGSISVGSSATAYNTSSDYRLKENVSDMSGAITRLKNLKPKRFNWISDENNELLDGFLAHEVDEVVPQAIHGEKDATKDVGTIKDADGNVLRENTVESTKKDGETWEKTGTEINAQGIDQSKLVPLLTGALQEAITKIESLETRIKTLEDA